MMSTQEHKTVLYKKFVLDCVKFDGFDIAMCDRVHDVEII